MIRQEITNDQVYDPTPQFPNFQGQVSAWKNGMSGLVNFTFHEPHILAKARFHFFFVYCWGLDAPRNVEVQVGDFYHTLNVSYADSGNYDPNHNTSSDETYFHLDLDMLSHSDPEFDPRETEWAMVQVFCPQGPDYENDPGRCGSGTTNAKCGLSEIEFFKEV